MTNLHSDKIENTNLHTTTNHIYTNTKLRKLLVPIIIEQLLASLMGTVDTMMVSNVGSAAISAPNMARSSDFLVIRQKADKSTDRNAMTKNTCLAAWRAPFVL